MVPLETGVKFALAPADKDISLTRSLEGLAKDALQKSGSIEDTMATWLQKWDHN